MNRESFLALLRYHEGLKLEAYRCKRGRLTIGYGHTGPDVHEGQKITLEEAERLLALDAASAVRQSRDVFPWFNALCDKRQNVIASMVFNMGLFGLKGFKKMLSAVEARDFEKAANEMLLSDWAGQVGRRAAELAQMMREGETVH